MTDERPLHVRVAEALGWSQIEPMNRMNLADPGIGYPPEGALVGRKVEVPRYDTDWSATGPLIERLGISIDYECYHTDPWEASMGMSGGLFGQTGYGKTPLLAVCEAILRVHEDGTIVDRLKAAK